MMTDSESSFVGGLILGAIVAFLLTLFICVGTMKDSPYHNDQAVCHYLHGTWHGDVCLVDGKAVITSVQEEDDPTADLISP